MTFEYLNNSLHCDSVSLTTLAKAFGTPLYVYSANRIRQNYRRLAAAFAPLRPLICYSVKANANLAILRLLHREGAGFDIVSGGELYKALKAGAHPQHIVFAGVGKTADEIDLAISHHVGWINIESEGELRRVVDIAARHGTTATVAIRLRPDVEADTHHHISTGSAASKFGVPVAQALELVRGRLKHVQVRGAHVHIGSQLASPQATLQAVEVALEFVGKANALGASIDTLDLGGGFPVAYRDDEIVPDIEAFAAPLVARLASSRLAHFHLEPGRSIIAAAAVLLTEVQYEKTDAAHRIVIVDAGMHTLLRPALYDAYHQVDVVTPPANAPRSPAHLAGPICETADFLAHDRLLPPVQSGDLIALRDAGAYGYTMASNYNSHPLPAEALVDDGAYRLIRRRQTFDDLIALDEG